MPERFFAACARAASPTIHSPFDASATTAGVVRAPATTARARVPREGERGSHGRYIRRARACVAGHNLRRPAAINTHRRLAAADAQAHRRERQTRHFVIARSRNRF